MSLQVFKELEQGTDEWLAARCGIVTTSVVGQLITTKTLKVAANETSRTLTMNLAAELIAAIQEDGPSNGIWSMTNSPTRNATQKADELADAWEARADTARKGE